MNSPSEHPPESKSVRTAGIVCAVLVAVISLGVALGVAQDTSSSRAVGTFVGFFLTPFIIAAIIRGIYVLFTKRPFVSGWLGVIALVLTLLSAFGRSQ